MERSLPLLVAPRKEDEAAAPIGETLVRPHAAGGGRGARQAPSLERAFGDNVEPRAEIAPAPSRS